MNGNALFACGAGAALFALAGGSMASRPMAAPALLINETTSVPRGLYVRDGDDEPKIGRLVTIAQPEAVRPYLASLGATPDLRLLKRVAAVGGEKVCASPGRLTTPRRQVAVASRDRRGVALPAWRGCRTLATGEVLLLGDSATSFDSRYFGPAPIGAIEAAYTEVIGW